MRLYKIKAHFLGKDLDENVLLEYVVTEDNDGIYDHIDTKYRYGMWSELVYMTREEIIAAMGDYESEPTGEFYDQTYGWEDLGEVSQADIDCLKRLKIITA